MGEDAYTLTASSRSRAGRIVRRVGGKLEPDPGPPSFTLRAGAPPYVPFALRTPESMRQAFAAMLTARKGFASSIS